MVDKHVQQKTHQSSLPHLAKLMIISLTGREERKGKINLKTLKQEGFRFENKCKVESSKRHRTEAKGKRN